MKQKILIIGITMAAAGSEKSFLSFAETLDYTKYDVDLLLAAREGAFLPLVPKPIRILDMGEMGELFQINRQNAREIIMRAYVRNNPLRLASLIPFVLKIKAAKSERARAFAADRLWRHTMKKMPVCPGDYDIALAYWGDHTMFYMVDKVRAEKKIAWLHFDYASPPREDALYRAYFSQCDRVITVSEAIEASLKQALPSVADRVLTVENRVSREATLRAAAKEADFGDDFTGLRLLTVGRICPQKGQDLALGAVKRLLAEGYPIRWYLIGDGQGDYAEKLRADAAAAGDAVRFLGVRENPYPLMRAADIYLQPSRHEGKPIAVEEAKILACPILATRYTAATEQLDGGEYGILCDASEDGIYAGLRKLLDEPAYRASLRETLRKLQGESGDTDPLSKILGEAKPI